MHSEKSDDAAAQKPAGQDAPATDEQLSRDDAVGASAVDEASALDSELDSDEQSGETEEVERLDLDVQIDSPSACERHVTVTIARSDIDRYLDEAYSELMPTAAVPGFRVGRAPRKLVEGRFKQEISERIKGSLLMDSLSQISDEQSFTAISEPDLDLETVEVPEEGPMTFEFDIEVRPEFELPKWQGLSIERPVRDFSEEDIDEQLAQMLTRFAHQTPVSRAVADGDYVTLNIRGLHDGQVVSEVKDRVVRVRPELSMLDARLEGFGELLAGANAGDTRTATVTLTQDAPNEQLRGQEVALEFEVLDVKELKIPELSEAFLEEIGGFEAPEDLRKALRANLERQLQYEQQRKVREQITAELTKTADWELPPGLLKRQSARELERAVMELRRAGFSEAEIRARENELRQNSAASTARALKQHFILERIAEEEDIEVEQSDFEAEIYLIAAQSGESPRRVRAQIEKRGMMDVLQNQITERKVLELVQSQADFQDVPFELRKTTAEAIAMAAGGEEEIPVAKQANQEDDEDATESAAESPSE